MQDLTGLEQDSAAECSFVPSWYAERDPVPARHGARGGGKVVLKAWWPSTREISSFFRRETAITLRPLRPFLFNLENVYP